VWQWVSARESSIAPDGLELIGKVLAAGVGAGHGKEAQPVSFGVGWLGRGAVGLAHSRMGVRTRRSRSAKANTHTPVRVVHKMRVVFVVVMAVADRQRTSIIIAKPLFGHRGLHTVS
jgi:hypothetical protein